MMSFRRPRMPPTLHSFWAVWYGHPSNAIFQVDEYLNDVRLFLPYFNQATVKGVIDELQNTEGGDIPTVIDEEALGRNKYAILTVHTRKKKDDTPIPGQYQAGPGMESLASLQQPPRRVRPVPERGRETVPSPAGTNAAFPISCQATDSAACPGGTGGADLPSRRRRDRPGGYHQVYQRAGAFDLCCPLNTGKRLFEVPIEFGLALDPVQHLPRRFGRSEG